MQQLFAPLIPYSQYHNYLSQKYAAASAVDEGSFQRLLKELEDAISTLLIQILSQDDDGSVNHYYDALKVLAVMYGRIQETQTAFSSSTSVGVNNAVTLTSNTTGVNVGGFQRVSGGINVNGSIINGNGIGTVESSVLQLSDPNMLNVNTPTTLGSVNGPYTKDYSATTLATGLTANNNGGNYTPNLGNAGNQINTHIHRHSNTNFSMLERTSSIGNAPNQLLNASNAGVNSAGNGNPTAIAATGVEGLELNDMYDPVSVPSHHSLNASGLLHQQSQQHQNPQLYHRQQQHQLPNHQQNPIMSLPMGSPQQHLPQQQHHQLQTPQQHPHHHPQQLQQQQQAYYYPMNYTNTNTATNNPSPNADSSHSGVSSINNNSVNNLRYYQQSQGSSSGVSHGSNVATNSHTNGAGASGNADYNQQYFYTLQRYPYLPPIPSQHHSGSSTGNHGTSSSISLGNGNSGPTANVPNGVNMNGASGTAAGPGFQNYLLDFSFTN